jgi:hypothetical protein
MKGGDRLTMGYFDNFNNEFSNNRKKSMDMFFYL